VEISDSEAMNKIGKLLQEEPTLGRVMASLEEKGKNFRRV
jgi:hypothetical protein